MSLLLDIFQFEMSSEVKLGVEANVAEELTIFKVLIITYKDKFVN